MNTLLLVILFILDLFNDLTRPFFVRHDYFSILPRVNGQFNVWIERPMVMQIIESMPHNHNYPDTLQCPRSRPRIRKQVPENLSLVLYGRLMHQILDLVNTNANKPIPPPVDMLRVKWEAGLERLTYNIDLKSMNQSLLHTPLLNIAKSGFVPPSISDLQISLPCTGRLSGIAPFHVGLDVRREFEGLRKIPHISLMVYKYCLSSARHTRFIVKCECRAQCSKAHPKVRKMARKRCIRRCRRRFGLANRG